MYVTTTKQDAEADFDCENSKFKFCYLIKDNILSEETEI
jgi:hypothetical protein